MTVVIRGLKVDHHRTEETPCFSSILVLDGVSVARVSNDGRGSCNTYDMLDGHDEGELGDDLDDLDTACFGIAFDAMAQEILRDIMKIHVVIANNGLVSTLSLKPRLANIERV